MTILAISLFFIADRKFLYTVERHHKLRGFVSQLKAQSHFTATSTETLVDLKGKSSGRCRHSEIQTVAPIFFFLKEACSQLTLASA